MLNATLPSGFLRISVSIFCGTNFSAVDRVIVFGVADFAAASEVVGVAPGGVVSGGMVLVAGVTDLRRLTETVTCWESDSGESAAAANASCPNVSVVKHTTTATQVTSTTLGKTRGPFIRRFEIRNTLIGLPQNRTSQKRTQRKPKDLASKRALAIESYVFTDYKILHEDSRDYSYETGFIPI